MTNERRETVALGASEPQLEAKTGAARWWPWVVLALILGFECGVRWRLRDFPLERDEGEYAYNAQLLIEGVPPYREAFASQKLPGTYFASAIGLALWCDLPAGLRLSLALANVTSTILLFALLRRTAGVFAACTAAAAFALLGIGAGVLGFAAHATHFVAVFTLGGLFLLHGALGRERAGLHLVAAGLLFGLAIVVRQPSAAFAAFGVVALVVEDVKARRSTGAIVRRAAQFSAGVVAPFAALCAWLWSVGVFETFWFWTFTYARAYGSHVSLAQGWRELRYQLPSVIDANLTLWIAAIAGLLLLALERSRRTAFCFGLLAATALAVSAGFYFRNHYFVQLLPLVAALFGLACGGPALSPSAATRWRRTAIPVALAALGTCAWLQREYLFELPTSQLCRAIYGGNLFVEAEIVGRELQTRCAADDRIAVLGSEAQIYAYAHRRSATGYIYTYSLMEETPFAARFQDEMIEQIETARPRFIVLVDLPVSWLARPHSVLRIARWAPDYLSRNYNRIGVVEAGMPARWDAAADAARPRNGMTSISVYERR